MSSYKIEELFSLLYKYNNLDSIEPDNVKDINVILNNIATGISIPIFYRNKLYNIFLLFF